MTCLFCSKAVGAPGTIALFVGRPDVHEDMNNYAVCTTCGEKCTQVLAFLAKTWTPPTSTLPSTPPL